MYVVWEPRSRCKLGIGKSWHAIGNLDRSTQRCAALAYYRCAGNTTTVLCLRRICAAEAKPVMLSQCSLCPVVSAVVPMFRSNTDSSARRVYPLHTLRTQQRRHHKTRAVFSCLSEKQERAAQRQ